MQVGFGEAEGGVEHGDEGGLRQSLEVGGVLGRGGPDEGGVVVGEREEGDRAAERGDEPLVRCRGGGGFGGEGVCGFFGGLELEGRDDAVEVVVPAVGGDASEGSDWAVEAVCADQEPGSDCAGRGRGGLADGESWPSGEVDAVWVICSVLDGLDLGTGQQ